jgi:hypothetical protein
MTKLCQCQPTCKYPPLEGSPFCENHIKSCPRISPRNGYEPKYEPGRWNNRKELRETHNCFAYAMNVHDPKQVKACQLDKNCNVPFHQPGSASGHPGFRSRKLKTCPDMVARLLGDNPSMKMTTFEAKCPAHTSKIALVVDPDEDYHFFRQDSNGFWSHKPGGTAVTNLDANDKLIYDPQLASRDYQESGSKLNYDTFCAYMCVPRDRPLHLKIGGKRSKTKQKTKKRFAHTRRKPRSV